MALLSTWTALHDHDHDHDEDDGEDHEDHDHDVDDEDGEDDVDELPLKIYEKFPIVSNWFHYFDALLRCFYSGYLCSKSTSSLRQNLLNAMFDLNQN